MEHEFFDGDISHCDINDVGEDGTSFIRIHGEEVEDECCPEYHLALRDLQYMAGLLGGKINEVSPDTVITMLSRDDIILLAKEAKLTTEELV